LDASTTRKYGGTGLGLAISQRLVTLMGGAMSVDSRVGQGSVFSFGLKLAVAPAPESPLRVLEGRCFSVRLADPCAARLMARGLEEAGASILECPAAGSIAIVDEEFAGPANGPCVVVGWGGKLEDAGERLVRPVRISSLATRLAERTVFGDLAYLAGATGSSPSAVSEPGPAVLRILLAEDNLVNRRVCQALLRKFGVEADVAVTGGDAFEKWRAGSYPLILMDCQMPEMDGLEATRRIRWAEGSEARVPIIALTANALPGDRERCLEAGMDGYLPKPYRQDELKVVLDAWLFSRIKPMVAADDSLSEAPGQPAENGDGRS